MYPRVQILQPWEWMHSRWIGISGDPFTSSLHRVWCHRFAGALPIQRYRVSDCLSMEGAIMEGSPQEQMQDSIPSEEGLLFVPDVQQHSGVPVDSCNLGPSCLDTLKACLLAKVYDKDTVDIMLKQHRDSSIRQYQSVWGKFLEFLLSKGISHSEVQVCHVFLFPHGSSDTI
ncbi:unnamed protein product [Meganyctiphanes norvegica]|uniref:Uncharacterized protein n=1 Tax=Meganyctiphanes norvegica TaxID=48144 RepID=A0AAV2QQW4_MEGNR